MGMVDDLAPSDTDVLIGALSQALKSSNIIISMYDRKPGRFLLHLKVTD